MAVSAVQERQTFASSGTTVALAFSSNNTAGNLLVYGSLGDITQTAATDSNTNTIANATSVVNGTAGAIRVDYVASAHAGANTVTAHQGAGGASIFVHIWEISGCTTTTPLRDSGTVASSATASVNTAGTSSLSGDAVLGFFYDFVSNATLTQGTGFTPSLLTPDSTNGDSAFSEFKAATAGGTQTATCGGNGTNALQQVVVVFIQASAGGPTIAQTVPAFYFDYEHNTRCDIWVSFDHGTPDVDHGDFAGLPILDKGVIFAPPQYEPSLECPSFKDIRWLYEQEPAADEGVVPPRLLFSTGVLEFIAGYDDHKESAPQQIVGFKTDSIELDRWTQFVIIPGYNPALSYGQTDNLDDQLPNLGYIGVHSDSGQDTTNRIILPVVAFDNDADLQQQWADFQKQAALDSGQDFTQFIVLPKQTFDDDSLQQRRWDDWVSNLSSDAGADTTNFLVVFVVSSASGGHITRIIRLSRNQGLSNKL